MVLWFSTTFIDRFYLRYDEFPFLFHFLCYVWIFFFIFYVPSIVVGQKLNFCFVLFRYKNSVMLVLRTAMTQELNMYTVYCTAKKPFHGKKTDYYYRRKWRCLGLRNTQLSIMYWIHTRHNNIPTPLTMKNCSTLLNEAKVYWLEFASVMLTNFFLSVSKYIFLDLFQKSISRRWMFIFLLEWFAF